MKTISLILILFMPLTAFARIGEDKSECLERYGKAQHARDTEFGVEYSFFQKSVYEIHANLWGGVVHQMGYTKGTEFTDLEVAYILKVNKNGGKWRRIDESTWMTKDGVLAAIREDANTLTIFTSKYARYYWDNKNKELEDDKLAALRGL